MTSEYVELAVRVTPADLASASLYTMPFTALPSDTA